ncbi:unnamed protein product [Vitrella brassicaformis CCMP3155]|uniref:Uncharacterized protein n=1 Tax=Vitrella brassicaformis (strain CCMP3155) TaxID=1169540 RepID=A0A0G4GDV6_VITBC|nr:unnamed protein product [Vitrella brassicaformis CCMP3155]|eukprot:CEM27166.1 unnamed protein product [Vitrella brassicaformis CCMP3155]
MTAVQHCQGPGCRLFFALFCRAAVPFGCAVQHYVVVFRTLCRVAFRSGALLLSLPDVLFAFAGRLRVWQRQFPALSTLTAPIG